MDIFTITEINLIRILNNNNRKKGLSESRLYKKKIMCLK